MFGEKKLRNGSFRAKNNDQINEVAFIRNF